MNHVVIGIEHLDAGIPGSVTPAQIQASVWLCSWLWETEIAIHAWKTGAVLDLNHLVQHKDFDPVNRPNCASWPLSRMQDHLTKITTLLAPPEPAPPDPEPVPPHDEWKYRFSALASEAEQWERDDEKHAADSAILRIDRIQQIARGDV